MLLETPWPRLNGVASIVAVVGAATAVDDTISEAGDAFGVAIVGSLARARYQPQSHRGPGRPAVRRTAAGSHGLTVALLAAAPALLQPLH
jgi:hypothetical protein